MVFVLHLYGLCAAEIKVVSSRVFSYIPTIWFYSRAKQAINKLGIKVNGEDTYGIVTRKDKGFKELGHVIDSLTGHWQSDVDEVKLYEFDIPSDRVYYQDPITFQIKFPKISHLSIVVKGKEEIIVMTENYSSNLIISKLLREAKTVARMKIIKIALTVLLLWLIYRATSLIIEGGNIWC